MIIFLDIDGVLNNATHPRQVGTVKEFEKFRKNWRMKYNTPYLCPQNIEDFVKFVNEYPEHIDCILSSTWRFGGQPIIDKLNFIFKDFGCKNHNLIIHRTKRDSRGYRGNEVKDFLDCFENDERLSPQIKDKNYIILDDDNDFLEEQQLCLFQCSNLCGFNKVVAENIKKRGRYDINSTE